MTIEATITRSLNIRFIDARELAIAAKLNLGIEGYPGPEQSEQLIQEITRIFHNDVSREERDTMQSYSRDLMTVKQADHMSFSSRSFSSRSFRSSPVPYSPMSAPSIYNFENSSLSASSRRSSSSILQAIESPKCFMRKVGNGQDYQTC